MVDIEKKLPAAAKTKDKPFYRKGRKVRKEVRVIDGLGGEVYCFAFANYQLLVANCCLCYR